MDSSDGITLHLLYEIFLERRESRRYKGYSRSFCKKSAPFKGNSALRS